MEFILLGCDGIWEGSVMNGGKAEGGKKGVPGWQVMEFVRDGLRKQLGPSSSPPPSLSSALTNSLTQLLHQLISSEGIEHDMYLGERPVV